MSDALPSPRPPSSTPPRGSPSCPPWSTRDTTATTTRRSTTPHIWMDPDRAAQMVETIGKGLSALDGPRPRPIRQRR